MANRLIHETSPYLVQHAHNPVDWYPWGEEALEKARREQKPIFLSVGYSACHWCHVMERESFEDPEIARMLNEWFVSIKVDREERPDLDQVYMGAVQLLSGHGGWPMSVFLTPELRPFYAGTYWPARASRGMPGFDQVLRAVAEAWQKRREQVEHVASEVAQRLREVLAATAPEQPLEPTILAEAARTAERHFDFQNGGFGTAPKFPHALMLRFLLRYGPRSGNDRYRQMVELNLDRMAGGGIYDHLGGGFARYSVDNRWLVPHFEKMLYDNALLSMTYLEGYLATGNEEYRRVVEETCDYVLRDLMDLQGGFYSSEDADSEGEEGKFYLWTPQQVHEILDPDTAQLFCRIYDVTDVGNFEGKNVLNLSKTWEQYAALCGIPVDELKARMAHVRRLLFERRSERVRPGRDTKVLTSWNSLMIDALSQAGAVLGRFPYVEAAQKAADFILEHLTGPQDHLWHCRQGPTGFVPGFLEDYAGMIVALVSLHDADQDETWIQHAQRFAETLLREFHDAAEGAFFYTSSSHDSPLVRVKDFQDTSLPSGNGLAAWGLIQLGQLLDEPRYLEAARRTVGSAVPILRQWPLAAGQLLLALDWLVGPMHEVVIVGDASRPPVQDWLTQIRRSLWMRRLLAIRNPRLQEHWAPRLNHLFAGRLEGPEPACYFCSQYVCQPPVQSTHEVRAVLDQLVGQPVPPAT